ncbi:hypothetical protein [Streptomyces avermitilis]|uniref:hypothetical protein n=1 Tax=Streptomyces avermitilis TaxID=33903 RepID=UPI0036870DA1
MRETVTVTVPACPTGTIQAVLATIECQGLPLTMDPNSPAANQPVIHPPRHGS